MLATPVRPSLPQRPVVAVVVQQHVEDAASLRHLRTVLVRAPHVGLLQLGRLDERIAANLDGLAVAAESGKALALAELERPGTGQVFALAVRALEDRDEALLDRLMALCPEVPEARRGLVSAFGWVPSRTLQGVVRRLLSSRAVHVRELGLAACRLHHADPGVLLTQAMTDKDPVLRAAASRAAGELGRLDLLAALTTALGDESPEVAFWSAWSASLLGERRSALKVLAAVAQQATPSATRALGLLMAASTPEEAGDFSRHLSGLARQPDADPAARRRLVRALALLGQLRFVPWLIERMAEPATAAWPARPSAGSRAPTSPVSTWRHWTRRRCPGMPRRPRPTTMSRWTKTTACPGPTRRGCSAGGRSSSRRCRLPPPEAGACSWAVRRTPPRRSGCSRKARSASALTPRCC
jgi:uncharacterized protein (TIGR02270 family)